MIFANSIGMDRNVCIAYGQQTWKYFIIPLTLVMCAVSIYAQPQVNSMAEAGRSEIFVYLGKGIVSSARPFQEISAYRVERREANKNTWTTLGEYSAPATESEFQSRFSAATRYFPQPHNDDPVPLGRIWQKITQYNTSDSIAPYNFYLPVMLALGYATVDITARTNVIYQYRISHRVNNAWQVAFVTNTTSIPATINILKPQSLRQFTQPDHIELTFIMRGSGYPVYMQVLRRDNFQGPFKNLRIQKALNQRADSLFLFIRDTDVVPRTAYEYVVKTFDRAGNEGPASDTVTVASYNFNEAYLPLSINTRNREDVAGILLSWRLDRPELCLGLRLYRSLSLDKDFEAIAELPPTDTLYIDQDVVPMTRYYYHFRLLGVLGESSVSSATVFGLYQSETPPLPPGRLRAETDVKGVLLRWQPGDDHIKGYYIYRGINGSALERISPLISDTTYLDQSTELSGKLMYDYALTSENSSHRISIFSDTVQARPGLPTIPIAPRELIAQRFNNYVSVSWLDVRDTDNSISHFELERSDGDAGYQPKGYRLEDNYFIDSTVVRGIQYSYRVRSRDLFEGVSDWSMEAAIVLEAPSGILRPPQGFQAFKGSNVITLRWGGVYQQGHTGFKIVKRTGNGQEVVVGTVDANTFEYTDKNVRRGERYVYTIITTGSGNRESERSSPVVVVY
jgi:hypothetical protein